MKTKLFYSVIVAFLVAMSSSMSNVYAESANGNSLKYVNVTTKNGIPVEKTLFKADGNKLYNVKQFIYSYDQDNRISQIDINYWNNESESWELRYTATYNYENGMLQQKVREFNVGTLKYEIVADINKIEEIMAH